MKVASLKEGTCGSNGALFMSDGRPFSPQRDDTQFDLGNPG